MKAHVDLKVSGELRRIEFELPEGGARPADLLPALRQFSNAMVAAAEAVAAEPISCTKGCVACCHHLVPIRAMEAHRLAALVEALPEPRRSEVLERFAAAARQLSTGGLRARLDARELLDQPGRIALKLDYIALGIACPFLHENLCGIYEERPMICREHLVTTPAAWCANPGGHSIHTLPIRRADAAAAKLEAGPAMPGWIPLVDLLTWVEEHPGDEAELRDPREMLQQFVRDLVG
jgi:Fe-S-cluster containining protein